MLLWKIGKKNEGAYNIGQHRVMCSLKYSNNKNME